MATRKQTKGAHSALSGATVTVLDVEQPEAPTAPEAPEAPEAAPVESDPQTEQAFIEWATPGTMTERGYVAPLPSALTWIDCDFFPNAVDFKIGIRLGIAFRVLKRREEAPGRNDRERALRTLALIAPEFENWPVVLDPLTQQPIAQPDPSDYNTYAPIGWWTEACPDFGNWIATEGYERAYRKATKGN